MKCVECLLLIEKKGQVRSQSGRHPQGHQRRSIISSRRRHIQIALKYKVHIQSARKKKPLAMIICL